MADSIWINGNGLSWGSITVKIDEERFTGFTSLGFDDKLEVTHGYGMGKHHAPRSRSRGKYIPGEVKLKGPISTVQEMREYLATKSRDGVSYGMVEFTIVASYVEAGEKPMLVEILRCRLVANTSGHEEGPDLLTDEVTINCMVIKRNGKTLFDNSDGTR